MCYHGFFPDPEDYDLFIGPGGYPETRTGRAPYVKMNFSRVDERTEMDPLGEHCRYREFSNRGLSKLKVLRAAAYVACT